MQKVDRAPGCLKKEIESGISGKKDKNKKKKKSEGRER